MPVIISGSDLGHSSVHYRGNTYSGVSLSTQTDVFLTHQSTNSCAQAIGMRTKKNYYVSKLSVSVSPPECLPDSLRMGTRAMLLQPGTALLSSFLHGAQGSTRAHPHSHTRTHARTHACPASACTLLIFLFSTASVTLA